MSPDDAGSDANSGLVLPPIVDAAFRRANDSGFTLSCEPAVGALLASLAAATPRDGRVLELGTGVGVGLGWIVSGLGERTDVEVVSVDIDSTMLEIARREPWPAWVRFQLGDGAELVGSLGHFDLVFADAPGGKIRGLDVTVGALRPGGLLVVDDMDLGRHEDAELRAALAGVREHLLRDETLVCAELDYSSGVIVAARKGDPGRR